MVSNFAKYDFVNGLESKWHLILGELQALLEKEIGSKSNYFDLWHEREIYRGQWKVFGLYAFGNKLTDNCALCPITTEIVESIPGMTTAGFSALKSQTHILPHRGYTSDVLRCHLGLIIPDVWPTGSQSCDDNLRGSLCGLKVGNSIYQWRQGKAFVFDDTELHEAWNRSNQARYVLLIDFLK